jgi:hypothetical protein
VAFVASSCEDFHPDRIARGDVVAEQLVDWLQTGLPVSRRNSIHAEVSITITWHAQLASPRDRLPNPSRALHAPSIQGWQTVHPPKGRGGVTAPAKSARSRADQRRRCRAALAWARSNSAASNL